MAGLGAAPPIVPVQWKTEGFGIFTGGVNLARPATDLQSDEVQDASNMVLHPGGYVTGREGSVKVNTSVIESGDAIMHVEEYIQRATQTSFRFAFTTNGKIFRLIDDGTIVEFTRASGVYATGRKWSVVVFQDKMFAVNGSDTPQVFDPATDATKFVDLSTLGTLHPDTVAPSYTAVHASRVWFFGDFASSKPYRLWGSAGLDPFNWNILNDSVQFNIAPDFGGRATGIHTFFDLLIIGKENLLMKLGGTSAILAANNPFIMKEVSRNTGFSNHWMVAQVNDDLWFLHGTAIKSLKGVDAAFDLRGGDPGFSITPTLQGNLPFPGINKTSLEQGFFVNDQDMNRLYVIFPETGQSQNTRFFAASYNFGEVPGWWPWSFPQNYSCITKVKKGQGSFEIYAGRYDGFVDKFTGSNDNGTKITRFLESKDFVFGSFQQLKRFPYLYLELNVINTGSVAILYKVDGGSEKTIKIITSQTGELWSNDAGDEPSMDWDDDDWAGTDTFGKNRYPIYGGRGRAISYVLRQDELDGNLTLFKGVAYAGTRSDRVYGETT